MLFCVNKIAVCALLRDFDVLSDERLILLICDWIYTASSSSSVLNFPSWDMVKKVFSIGSWAIHEINASEKISRGFRLREKALLKTSE